MAPKGKGDLVVDPSQDGNEVGFESLYCLFWLVSSVLSWGHKFVLNVVVFYALLLLLEHLLSSTCFLTPDPAAPIWFINFWYTLTISPSVLFFIGSA